jgi:hypothetical protein
MNNNLLNQVHTIAKFQRISHPEIREGQSLMNALADVNIDLYREITATEFDPYYLDSRIPAFYEKLTNSQLKTFPIIVINKSNMSTLMHFKDADKAALFLINDNGFNAKNWIIIKNENKVVDISDLEGIFGVYTQHQKIRKAIEDS